MSLFLRRNRRLGQWLALSLAVTWLGFYAPVEAAVSAPAQLGNKARNDVHYRVLPFATGGRIERRMALPEAPRDSVDSSMTGLPVAAFSAQYQWPAVYFLAAFKGDEIVLAFNDGAGKFRFSVDGQPGEMIVRPGHRTVRFDHLGSGYHTVRLETVSVPSKLPGAFDGFFIPTGETALEPPFGRRQMEFIGDSFAVGIGNHSSSRQCSADEVYDTTDTQDAWGPITARHFAADYQLNAISGRGVVRNYKGSVGDPIPVVYPFVLFDKKVIYHDDKWRPQIIVIALGRNDFLPGVHQGERWGTDDALRVEVMTAFVAFVKGLRARNPQAHLVLLSYDPGIVSDVDQEVVQRLVAEGETRIGFLEVSDIEKSGCGGHPTLNDERKISDALTAYIDVHLGIWK
jgi:hypothetical protein